MKYLFCILFFFSSTSFANDSEIATIQKQALTRILDPFFKCHVDDEIRIVEYCPETPCEQIQFYSSVNEIVVFDFTILYFLYNSDYPEFKDGNYKIPSGFNPFTELSKLVTDISNRYLVVSNCSENVLKEKCMLEFIGTEFEIKINVVTEAL